MDTERSWRTTGLPAGRVRIGWPRWELGPLLGGACFGTLGFLAFYLVLLAIPWAPGAGAVDWPVFVPPGAVFLAGCVAYTISREWRTCPRLEPWSLVSAWLCAMAFLVGFFAFNSLAGDVFWEGRTTPGSLRAVWSVLALFAMAFLAALVGSARIARSGTPRRGWIFVIWGLYMPLWFGGIIVRGLIYPLVFVEPTPLELTLPEIEGATITRVHDPRVVSPLLRIDAEGRLWYESELLPDEDLPGVIEDCAARMPWRLHPDVGREIPDNPVRLWAAADVSYERVVDVITAIHASGIWKARVAVRRTARPWLGEVWTYVLRQPDAHSAPSDSSSVDNWGEFLASELDRSGQHDMWFYVR